MFFSPRILPLTAVTIELTMKISWFWDKLYTKLSCNPHFPCVWVPSCWFFYHTGLFRKPKHHSIHIIWRKQQMISNFICQLCRAWGKKVILLFKGAVPSYYIKCHFFWKKNDIIEMAISSRSDGARQKTWYLQISTHPETHESGDFQPIFQDLMVKIFDQKKIKKYFLFLFFFL